ncbi:uncharacterized protein LOC129976367 isoform X2 [Argiope bruennichi]|uniref:uncharacterized protein LOC129976367 isoform X2 n=1 Tax=Argiope bruennichi TaxID=94029 RepID=UPI0024946F25|nr:uncharacterized protein LOC129976367 isoform X2 [Argiope bruennichi]
MSTYRCKEEMPFLERSVKELGWIKSNYCLLIAGIAGIDFAEELLKKFPKLRIIATDKETQLIESARYYNTYDNVTYCVADIEKRETLKFWFGTARKILSYHNLERVTNVKTAFENFYDLLVPGGTLAVRFTPQNCIFKWIKEVSFRWRQFDLKATSLPQLTEENSDISFQNMLRSIGFEILYFRNVDECRQFKSDAQCKKFLLSCCFPLFTTLPDRMKRGFVDDMFHRFAKYFTKDEQGVITVHYRVREMFLKKPQKLL